MKSMEEKIQDALIEILKEFGIPKNQYSLGGYVEETICLEKIGSTWSVYGGERGQRHNVISHINCKSACLDLLGRVAKTRVEEERINLAYVSTSCSPSLKEGRAGTHTGQEPGGRS